MGCHTVAAKKNRCPFIALRSFSLEKRQEEVKTDYGRFDFAAHPNFLYFWERKAGQKSQKTKGLSFKLDRKINHALPTGKKGIFHILKLLMT